MGSSRRRLDVIASPIYFPEGIKCSTPHARYHRLSIVLQLNLQSWTPDHLKFDEMSLRLPCSADKVCRPAHWCFGFRIIIKNTPNPTYDHLAFAISPFSSRIVYPRVVDLSAKPSAIRCSAFHVSLLYGCCSNGGSAVQSFYLVSHIEFWLRFGLEATVRLCDKSQLWLASV